MVSSQEFESWSCVNHYSQLDLHSSSFQIWAQKLLKQKFQTGSVISWHCTHLWMLPQGFMMGFMMLHVRFQENHFNENGVSACFSHSLRSFPNALEAPGTRLESIRICIWAGITWKRGKKRPTSQSDSEFPVDVLFLWTKMTSRAHSQISIHFSFRAEHV